MFAQDFNSSAPIAISVLSAITAVYYKTRLVRERADCRSKHKQASSVRESVNVKLQREASENARLDREIQQLHAQIRLLDTRNNVLNRRIAAQELFLESRNAQLETLLVALKKQEELKPDKQLSKQIRELIALAKSQDHWKHFFEHFEQVNNQMLARLWSKHPNLHQNDLRYLSYIYMNLSAKEISAVLNISHEAARKRHERIRAKLGLDGSVSVMGYLTTL